MTEELIPPVREINGINLDNYFPYKRSFNSVLYVHKRLLENNESDKAKKSRKVKKPKVKQEKYSAEKCLQVYAENVDAETGRFKGIRKEKVFNDSLIEHTVQFAKDIAPLAIPVNSRDSSTSPVFYTVKASHKKCKKCRFQSKCDRISNSHVENDTTYEKRMTNKIVETYRKQRFESHKESLSTQESASPSYQSNNTLDELNLNHSLSCSYSELSEKKHKNGRCNKKKNESQKFVASESFEALATEMINVPAGKARIKIHLMNETDKNALSENIKYPIINAITETLAELNQYHSSDLNTVHNYMQNQNQKLDAILYKLTCIENKIDEQAKSVLKAQSFVKRSKLEELGEDILEIRDNSSEDSCRASSSAVVERKNRVRATTPVIAINDREDQNDMGRGENIPELLRPSTASGILRQERPARLPARFCWTDAVSKE